MDKKSILPKVIGVAVSVGVLFGLVWVASRAWKEGQK
jgi:hypothetical protein